MMVMTLKYSIQYVADNKTVGYSLQFYFKPTLGWQIFHINVHEGPQNVSQKPNSVILERGMIITNEPGIYKEGKYGIRTENVLLVCEDENTEFGRFIKLTSGNLFQIKFQRLIYFQAPRFLFSEAFLSASTFFSCSPTSVKVFFLTPLEVVLDRLSCRY